MATTALVVVSDRYAGKLVMTGTVTSVALDAAGNELFTIPVTIGDIFVEALEVDIGALSGAYVAPAPPFDGSRVAVYDASGSTVDIFGSSRYVHYTTSSTRPGLTTSYDLQNRVLVRANERLHVDFPVLAGAGVTGNVFVVLRALRLRAP